MGMWNGWNGMNWGMGWGWLFLVLLIAGIAVLVAVLVRQLGGARPDRDRQPRATPFPGSAPSTGPSARQILDERYARGEIDGTEYDERRRHLEDGSGAR
ncbi:SHOCT domain-containing protein [Georgenia yuyongxinii]